MAVAGLHSINQAQFWDVRDFPADYGNGEVGDCLSVCVSEWDKPGILYGKTAKECTREEVAVTAWLTIIDVRRLDEALPSS